MLSAFKAQPIHELKQRDKSKIESLLAYGDRLLVGLNTGALRIYRVHEAGQSEAAQQNGNAQEGEPPPSPTKTKAVELLREEEKFSRRPVQQLAIVKEVNLLVSWSDGYISLHDLQSYQLVERLDKTKGAACFAVTSNVVKDNETGVPSLVSRLAVGVKRKVLCWTWQDMEQLPEALEIDLEASVKSLTWATGKKLVTGMDAGFALVDVESLEVTPINKPVSRGTEGNATELAGVRFGAVSSSGMGYMGMGSWVPKPMITGLSNGHVLLAKDVNTLFADSDGNALEKRQIPWALAPEAIGYSYPYLLGLQPPEKGSLQIRNPDTLSLLQTISVPNAAILHVPQPNISLAHAGKGFLVASDRAIWRMNALPYHTQLHDLVEKERFDEAISLLNLLEDTLIDGKAGRIRDIMIQKAAILFQDRKYRPALDLFTDAEAPPERVIKLYPPAIAGVLSEYGHDSDEVAAEDATAPAQTHVESSKEAPQTPSRSLLGRMTGSHKKKDSDGASVQPAPQDGEVANIRRTPTSRPSKELLLEGEDLKLATRTLCSFLVQARTRMQRYINFDGTLKEDPPSLDGETGRPAFANLLPQHVLEQDNIQWREELLETAKLLDTTLFRAYMLASPSLAGPLFRLDNFCDPEVVQSALYETQRYNDLIDFLYGKKLHRQALEMLAKFGKGEAEGEVPEGLSGPERTVGYLKQLPPELTDMILEFVRWPLSAAPDEGMSVFVADSDNAEKLPKDRVVEYLAETDTKLEARYLEHIIRELNEQDPAFHQRLVDIYLEQLKHPADNSTEQEESATKSRLEAFLTKSRHYNKAKTFRQLAPNEAVFFESRAIVLSAMGNHKQALAIYVFQLQDYAKAEEYCNRTYLAEHADEQQACLVSGAALHESRVDREEQSSNIFAVLLGLYLRPPAEEGKRWPQALDLLSRHGARLPASSTLDLMPPDLAVSQLTSYFRGRMRLTTSQLYSSRVTKALEGVRQVNAERHLLLGGNQAVERGVLGGRNRRVRIGEDDHCRVCLRRFGASAVRVYPGGDVVHYGCVQRREAAGGVGDGGGGAQRRGWG